MSRNRNRKPVITVKPFKELAEGEPLETAQKFDALRKELEDTCESIYAGNAQAYLDAITELRLTKEAERAAEGWPT